MTSVLLPAIISGKQLGKKPKQIYKPDTDEPNEPLPPPLGKAKPSHLRWIDDLRFDEVSDDPEPEYVDTDCDS